MAKKATKLNYKYIDKPHGYVGIDHLWGQDFTFNCEPTFKTKKELLNARAKIVRDVAKVFAKYGIDTETFNCQNEWI